MERQPSMDASRAALTLELDDGRRRETDDGAALPSPLATEPPSPHSAKAAVWPSARPRSLARDRAASAGYHPYGTASASEVHLSRRTSRESMHSLPRIDSPQP